VFLVDIITEKLITGGLKMKHKKCGGKFVKIEKTSKLVTYQCTRCSKIITIHKKTATGGSPAKLKKEVTK